MDTGAPAALAGEAFKAEGATVASVTAAPQGISGAHGTEGKAGGLQGVFLERTKPGDENLAREYGQVYDGYWNCLSGWKDFLGAEKADMKNYIPRYWTPAFQEIKWA